VTSVNVIMLSVAFFIVMLNVTRLSVVLPASTTEKAKHFYWAISFLFVLCWGSLVWLDTLKLSMKIIFCFFCIMKTPHLSTIWFYTFVQQTVPLKVNVSEIGLNQLTHSLKCLFFYFKCHFGESKVKMRRSFTSND
jgi:hypothetical protein